MVTGGGRPRRALDTPARFGGFLSQRERSEVLTLTLSRWEREPESPTQGGVDGRKAEDRGEDVLAALGQRGGRGRSAVCDAVSSADDPAAEVHRRAGERRVRVALLSL